MAKSARRPIAGDGICIGLAFKDQPFIRPETKPCRHLAEALVEEISKHETLSKVKLSSIQITHNTISSPHRDNNPGGYPFIRIGFGDFEGGQLKAEEYAAVSICGKAVVSDGLTTHSSSKLNGDRSVHCILHPSLIAVGVEDFGSPET